MKIGQDKNGMVGRRERFKKVSPRCSKEGNLLGCTH